MYRQACVVVFAMVALFLVPAPQQVTARPLYKKVWDEMYRERLPEKTKVSCSICHPEKSKGKKNKYGKALEEELGEKNVKDRELIREALKKIEDQLRLPVKPDRSGDSSVATQPRSGGST